MKWTYEEDSHDGPDDSCWFFRRILQDGEGVGLIDADEKVEAYLLKAANCHADLLAACEAVVADANGRNHGFHCATKAGGDCNCSVGLARAAIAKAKGSA